MANKDYVFYINWEDRHKQTYRIGFLAQLDESFYLIIKNEEKAQIAYKNGFIGLPGFKSEEVYKSRELFDFFKSRILQKSSSTPCEELATTGAKSMIDSFSVEKLSDKLAQNYKNIILEMYDLQTRKVQIQEQKEVEKIQDNNRDNNSEELPDIE